MIALVVDMMTLQSSYGPNATLPLRPTGTDGLQEWLLDHGR
jgi:hypothetical protein